MLAAKEYLPSLLSIKIFCIDHYPFVIFTQGCPESAKTHLHAGTQWFILLLKKNWGHQALYQVNVPEVYGAQPIKVLQNLGTNSDGFEMVRVSFKN